MSFQDGVEIWYEADHISIVRDPGGIGGVAHLAVDGAPHRPTGDYLEVHNATFHSIAVEV